MMTLPRTPIALTLLALAAPLHAQSPAPPPPQSPAAPPPHMPAPPPGIPALQKPISDLAAAAIIPISKSADWVVILPDAVWVAGKRPHVVVKIDAKTNRILATVPLPGNPCAGLAAGFGSIWVPLCADRGQPAQPRIARVDESTGAIVTIIDQGPPTEGGIAASDDSIWFASDGAGTLIRLDPRTNTVLQTIRIAADSTDPIVADGRVWITSNSGALLTEVDAATGQVRGTVPTGPKPRFLTAGNGAIWTLNQGDGTVTRVDAQSRTVTATIALGIPGQGGDIAYGGGRIWATAIGIPLSAIDAATNQVVGQWTGAGGDSLRYGHDGVWLTDLRGGTVARITVPAKPKG